MPRHDAPFPHPPLDHPPLDLRAVLRAVDRDWPGWEAPRGGTPAPWGFLVGVEADGGRLVHRPLAGHPAQVLTGWSAPGRWCVVGVAVRGTARRTVAVPGDEAAARVVWVCHRDGRCGSLLGLAGQPVTVVVSDTPGSVPDEGRVPALLRQALTGPPPP